MKNVIAEYDQHVAKLELEIQELKDKNDRLLEYSRDFFYLASKKQISLFDENVPKVQSMQDRIKELKEYVSHKFTCSTFDNKKEICNCGLEKALKS